MQRTTNGSYSSPPTEVFRDKVIGLEVARGQASASSTHKCICTPLTLMHELGSGQALCSLSHLLPPRRPILDVLREGQGIGGGLWERVTEREPLSWM